MKKATMILLSVLIASCKNPRDGLQKALEAAGPNRSELEQVLSRYARIPGDSLKLRAAMFLIANMPGHYSYVGAPLDAYMEYMDSLYPSMPYTVRRVVYAIPDRDPGFTAGLMKAYDVEILSARFLIDHIDNRMECRERVPWLNGLSFEDFCEYVLPYRAENERLDGWADSTRYIWREVAERMRYYPDLPPTVENAVLFQKDIAGKRDDPYLSGLRVPWGVYDFDCIDRSFYDVHCFRATGAPCTVDFIPRWPTRNGQHYWSAVIDREKIQGHTGNVLDPKAAKVYRKTYSHNPLPSPRCSEEFVPELFRDPFNRDVSSRYMKVADAALEPDIRPGHEPEYLYLCVFNNLDWQPVAWAPIRKGKAVFRDMGLNIVCLPVYYAGERPVQAGYPFLFDADGNIRPLQPDSAQRISMRFTRKYPLTFSKTQWARNLIGACFEGSDDPAFEVGDTVHIIEKPTPDLNFATVPLDTGRAYRCWRISKKGRFLNLGELSFIGKDGRPLTGKIISQSPDKRDADAFDGDVRTYNHSFSWVGMDFGEPVALSAIRYIPRTDGNGIRAGDAYRLLYHGPDGWIEAGTAEAETDEIRFDGLPSGSLYWLRNLSQGSEERIFTWENGRKVFR